MSQQGWWGLVVCLVLAVASMAAMLVVQLAALLALAMVEVAEVATAKAFREEALVAQTAARAVGQHSD